MNHVKEPVFAFAIILVLSTTLVVSARDSDPLVEGAILRLEARGAIVKPFRVAELGIEGNVVRLGDENDGRLLTPAGKIDPAVVADLKAIPELLLEIRGPSFANAGLNDLLALKNMLGLDVAGTKVTRDALPDIAKMQSLRLLDLSFDEIDGKSLAALASLNGLQFLALIDTRLDDSAVRPLRELKSLRYLEMGGTNLSPRGQESVQEALKACQIRWPARRR